MLSYQDALDFLYQQLPMYQRVGASAFKKDLTNTRLLCAHLGNPQTKFNSIHVAGTNGKGSSSHMLAAILQASGYKTGLYTSPHLKDFSERIRVNGEPISQESVLDFVRKYWPFLEEVKPSFFEMTVGMAFEHFAQQKVDIAIIEVGLGGRFDSTNIIHPLVSLITNIGLDHTDMLGTTLEEIAGEKAGIIKTGVPVVVGEYHPETFPVFQQKAKAMNSSLVLATDKYDVHFLGNTLHHQRLTILKGQQPYLRDLEVSLLGAYQQQNIKGVLSALDALPANKFTITEEGIRTGLGAVQSLTGLKGRWQILNESPTAVADTGHNQEAFVEILRQIKDFPYRELHMVLGFVQGKAINRIFSLLPKDANYYFCQPQIPRALAVEIVAEQAEQFQLTYQIVPGVNQAYQAARKHAQPSDFIFVGGSTFVVAELDDI